MFFDPMNNPMASVRCKTKYSVHSKKNTVLFYDLGLDYRKPRCSEGKKKYEKNVCTVKPRLNEEIYFVFVFVYFVFLSSNKLLALRILNRNFGCGGRKIEKIITWLM